MSSSSDAVEEVVEVRTKPLPARFARASGSTKFTVNLRPSHVAPVSWSLAAMACSRLSKVR